MNYSPIVREPFYIGYVLRYHDFALASHAYNAGASHVAERGQGRLSTRSPLSNVRCPKDCTADGTNNPHIRSYAALTLLTVQHEQPRWTLVGKFILAVTMLV